MMLKIGVIILVVAMWFASYKVWVLDKQEQELIVEERFWQSGDKVQFSVNGVWVDGEIQ
jgi:hypothetical protein|tara:strand:- start:3744 stop:3920 length:177 start_codon:yes stop_codon:yes gene_type:complete